MVQLLWDLTMIKIILMSKIFQIKSSKRQVDMFCRQRGYKLEQYLDTNYNNDLDPDHYMFAFQVTKNS